MARVTGKYEHTAVAGEEIRAFVPSRLPPADPPLRLDSESMRLLGRADNELSRLALASEMVPSVDWFIYGFVRKEAVISSQIEGTQATLVDLLTFEAQQDQDAAPNPEVQEVCNYLEALAYARRQLHRRDGLPISMRMLDGAHKRLMKGARGSDKQPGQIRRSQNWVGGTRPGNAVFVPPPPNALNGVLSDFEKYIHADDDLPPLVRAGLLHHQFETIHPYLDGNGRIGRLLVTLLLEQWDLLAQPLLYLSLFFKRNRGEYYQLLNAVRIEGDWESWILFFLEGVATIAKEATDMARDLFALVSADRARALAAPASSLMAVRLFEELGQHPIVTISRVTELLDITKPTATKAVNTLVDAGILTETTGRRRDRTYSYAAYLDRLRVGTELEG
jgi:Fic family protein